MADQKISGLPADTSLDDNHYVLLNDPTGPTTKRTTLGTLRLWLKGVLAWITNVNIDFTNFTLLGYVKSIATFSTTSSSFVYVTGLGKSVVIPAGVTKVKITVSTYGMNNPSNYAEARIFKGATVGALTTALSRKQIPATAAAVPLVDFVIDDTVTPGSTVAYSFAIASQGGSGTTTLYGGDANMNLMTVEVAG